MWSDNTHCLFGYLPEGTHTVFSGEAVNVTAISIELTEIKEELLNRELKYEKLYKCLVNCNCNISLKNSGAKYDDVGSKQKGRKREEIRQHTNIAMCFAKTYGIEITNIFW
jgi:hypothetical protein